MDVANLIIEQAQAIHKKEKYWNFWKLEIEVSSDLTDFNSYPKASIYFSRQGDKFFIDDGSQLVSFSISDESHIKAFFLHTVHTIFLYRLFEEDHNDPTIDIYLKNHKHMTISEKCCLWNGSYMISNEYDPESLEKMKKVALWMWKQVQIHMHCEIIDPMEALKKKPETQST